MPRLGEPQNKPQSGTWVAPGEGRFKHQRKEGVLRTMMAQQTFKGSDTLLLSHLHNSLSGGDRAASATKGAVGDNVNALLLAELDNLSLGQVKVEFDLVDGRDNLGG